jgi:hypothetical protein
MDGYGVYQDLSRKLSLFVDLPPARNLRCAANDRIGHAH